MLNVVLCFQILGWQDKRKERLTRKKDADIITEKVTQKYDHLSQK